MSEKGSLRHWMYAIAFVIGGIVLHNSLVISAWIASPVWPILKNHLNSSRGIRQQIVQLVMFDFPQWCMGFAVGACVGAIRSNVPEASRYRGRYAVCNPSSDRAILFCCLVRIDSYGQSYRFHVHFGCNGRIRRFSFKSKTGEA